MIICNVTKVSTALLELQTIYMKIVVATCNSGQQIVLIPLSDGRIRITPLNQAFQVCKKIIDCQDFLSWEISDLDISYNTETQEITGEQKLVGGWRF